jgi:hypothetical protein
LRERNDGRVPVGHRETVSSSIQERQMKSLRTIVLVSAVGLAMGVATAQPAGGKGPGAGPAASAPRMGMGPGGGRGAARWGADHTPGWALMTQQERDEHRERMRAMTTYEECNAFRQQHHEQMAARAKERGLAAPAQPRRDACGGLKK